MSRTTFDALLEAGAHFGHLKRKWNLFSSPAGWYSGSARGNEIYYYSCGVRIRRGSYALSGPVFRMRDG